MLFNRLSVSALNLTGSLYIVVCVADGSGLCVVCLCLSVVCDIVV